MKKINWEELKQKMKSPPPERLAKIEYTGHFLNIIGIIFTGILLIKSKTYWYIIFAFIFGILVSYSQGMTAYQRYKSISSLTSDKQLPIEQEISFTRKRSRIIEENIGQKAKWLASLIAVVLSASLIDPTSSRWYINLLFVLLLPVTFIITYFFGIYYIANFIRNKKLKVQNG